MSSGSRARILGGLAAAAAGLVAAGTAAEVLAERRAARRVHDDLARGREPLGSLRGSTHPVTTEDGVALHVEVDEPEGDDPTGVTVVFVHGYALNQDSWHFQRKALRGRHRLVCYDHRSHGRSGRSDDAHSTIEQLGADLRVVLDAVASRGPVVLVGHSMGAMTVMALAEQAPELFGEWVTGVALLATSAGDIEQVTLGLPGWPGRMMHRAAPGTLAALARVPTITETGRRAGSELAYTLTRRYAFGNAATPELTEFTDEMLSATPIGVVSAFFPGFARHNRQASLRTLSRLPVLVVGGTLDRMTPMSHSQAIARLLPSAELLELEGAGHLLILERADEVNEALTGLIERAVSEAVA